MSDDGQIDLALGDILQEFVTRVSHLQGRTLTVLTEESVTLQQVLLLQRDGFLRQDGERPALEMGHPGYKLLQDVPQSKVDLPVIAHALASCDQATLAISGGRIGIKWGKPMHSSSK